MECVFATHLSFQVMLVYMTSVFTIVNQGMPPTSNVKMMDIWLVFNLLLPFCGVMLLTLRVTLST